jgi:nitric oxide reductase activation protein
MKGVDSFCITLDSGADEYVASLFGSNRYAIIDNVESLPEKLPRLLLSLTR